MVTGVEATYMDFTRRTARYPKRKEKEYLMLGLMNEAGEVGGAYKKEIRDDVDNTAGRGATFTQMDAQTFASRLTSHPDAEDTSQAVVDTQDPAYKR